MKTLKSIDMENMLNNALKGGLNAKDESLAKLLLTSLQEQREEYQKNKGNTLFVQIDTDDDFSINQTEGFNVSLNNFGTYDVKFEMKKNESRSEALKRCIKTLDFKIREEKRSILENLLFQIDYFAGSEIDKNGLTSFGGNVTITAYTLNPKDSIDFSSTLKIKLYN